MRAEDFIASEVVYEGLNGSQHALLFAIFRCLYRHGFPESLRIETKELSRLSGLSRRTVERSREKLVDYTVGDKWLVRYDGVTYSINYEIYERQDDAGELRQIDASDNGHGDERQYDVCGMRQIDVSDSEVGCVRQDGGSEVRQNDAGMVWNSSKRQYDASNGKRHIDVSRSRHFDGACFSEDDYPVVADNWRRIGDFGKRQNDAGNERHVGGMRQIDAGNNGWSISKRQNDASKVRHGDAMRQGDAVEKSGSVAAESLVVSSVATSERQNDAKKSENFAGIYNNNNIYLEEEEEEFKNFKISSSSSKLIDPGSTRDIDLEEEKEKEKIKKEKEREEFLKNLPELKSKGPDPVDGETRIDALMRYWYYELPVSERKSYAKLGVLLVERFDRDYFLKNKCGVLNDVKRMMLVRIGLEYSFDADRVMAVAAKVASTIKNPAYMITFIHNELFPEDRIEV